MHEGQVIAGRYQLQRKLGAGGMGEVWPARDKQLNRDVAIKGVLTDDPDLRHRLEVEGKTLASIDHPGVVHLFDVIVEGPDTFLVMQYIPGSDLRTTMQRSPGISGDVKVRILTDVLTALVYLHEEAEVLHRDLKPSNILLDGKGRVYLADFGIARAFGRTQTELTGKIRGSEPYMAPEVLAGRAASPASDVWSFGAVALWLFTGKTPREGVPANDFAGAYTAVVRAALGEMRPSAYDLLRSFLSLQSQSLAAGNTRTSAQTTALSASAAAKPRKKQNPARWILIFPVAIVLLAAFAFFLNLSNGSGSTASQGAAIGNTPGPSTSPPEPSPTPTATPAAPLSTPAAALPKLVTVTLQDAVFAKRCDIPASTGSTWGYATPVIAGVSYADGFSCGVAHRADTGILDFLVPASAKRFTVTAGQMDKGQNTSIVERFEVINTVTGAVLATADLPFSQGVAFDVPVVGVSRVTLKLSTIGSGEDPAKLSGEAGWAEPRFVV